MPASTHDPKAVIVLFDGLRLEGYTENDISAYERLQDPDVQIGADGHTSVTRPSATAEIVTLVFYPSSTGYKILADTYAAEQAQVGALPTHEFYQENAVTGDVISDKAARILQGPTFNEGAQAGPREFRILLPKPTKSYGENIVV